MTEFELFSLALRAGTFLVATASVGVAIAALATVRAGIRAMERNAAQRAAEHNQRHEEAMLALRSLIDGQREQGAALAALIGRTATTGGAQ